MNDVTLQINLSPGDSAYAGFTVPALLAHHSPVAERLLVVDLCKPQATKIVDPAGRFPEPAFSERAARISALAGGWLDAGQVDRVVYLRPGDPLLPVLSRTYLRPWMRETHDYGGCALMAYLAAFELCRTRWLLHYDADMLLYQAPGFNWVAAAQAALAPESRIVAAIPRPAPPDAANAPSAAERLPNRDLPAGWTNTWFSTRCYLFDLERLRPLLPLVQGWTLWECLLARGLRRGYPRSPEGLLFRRMRAAGRSRLALRDSRAWLLHPTRKDAAFVAALPALLSAIARNQCPEGQRGRQDLDLDLWFSAPDGPLSA